MSSHIVDWNADEMFAGATFTAHAATHLRQRGLSEHDVELVRRIGEPVHDGFLMTRRALRQREAELKRELQQLARLADLMVIEVDGAVITQFYAERRRRPSWRRR